MDAHADAGLRPLIDWGVASMPLAGQVSSGDLHVVAEFPGGALVGVVDGLGHGEEAREAAEIAVAAIGSSARSPVEIVMKRCHDHLRGTRGVAMTLASIDVTEGAMTWLGVGNVEAVLVRRTPDGRPSHEGVVQRGGVVGYQLPRLVSSVTPVTQGDTLILATDGIRSGFRESLAIGEPPQRTADRILEGFRRESDDALVLVARVEGEAL